MQLNGKNTSVAVHALLFLSFLYFVYLIVSVPEVQPIWNFFPDQNDYLRQSQMSLLSKSFYMPEPAQWFTPRAFTMSLMYKLAGSDPVNMFYFQKILYCFAVMLFVMAVSLLLEHPVLKLLAGVSLLFFFTWWAIVGWSNNILSESVSFSWFLIWAAFIVFYVKTLHQWLFVLLFPVTLLFSFTRDTWPYLLLLFHGMLMLLFVIKKQNVRNSVLLFVFTILVLVFQSQSVKAGQRDKLPVFNVIAGRIAQSDEHLKWFEERGMPQAEQLKADFRGIKVDTDQGKAIIYKRYVDSTYIPLFDWVVREGKSTYQKFLLTHFRYAILNDQTPEQLNRVFAFNTFAYYQRPYGFFHNANNVFPLFNVYVGLLMVLVCVRVWQLTRKDVYLLPMLFSLMMVANAYLSYNADTMEVERHMYLVPVAVELLSMLSLFMIIQYLISGGIKTIFASGKNSRKAQKT